MTFNGGSVGIDKHCGQNATIANTAFYATVQPAKLNNLDVVKYLELIFEAYTRSQNLDLKAYLPWNSTVQRICGK
ncbi:hypothetical protein [Limosilactobacillus mucosae]|uniref:hypothetical protein n=1 Tax=Limosilactobacillus mucosae TaxID=97478 RepID=UPI0006527744|nr:hypothetical protein [Limosilactobacillus mucosae]